MAVDGQEESQIITGRFRVGERMGIMIIFSGSYYNRRVGESLPSYFRRTLIASSISYLVLGIPTLAIIGIVKGIPLERYLMPRAIYLYFAVIIGSTLGRLVRGKFNKVEIADK